MKKKIRKTERFEGEIRTDDCRTVAGMLNECDTVTLT